MNNDVLNISAEEMDVLVEEVTDTAAGLVESRHVNVCC